MTRIRSFSDSVHSETRGIPPVAVGETRIERIRAADVPGVPANVWAEEAIERGALHVVVDPVTAIVDGGPWSAAATFPA